MAGETLHEQETFAISGDVLEQLRMIQIVWDCATLQDALELAINLCPERYSDD